VIRDAVIHLLNEQPLLADLPAMPSPGDVAVICTNLRTLDRKRPFFVDASSSTFVLPYSQVRFIEIPGDRGPVPEERAVLSSVVAETVDLPLDEELLRRVRDL
jgi:hypothetical protein